MRHHRQALPRQRRRVQVARRRDHHGLRRRRRRPVRRRIVLGQQHRDTRLERLRQPRYTRRPASAHNIVREAAQPLLTAVRKRPIHGARRREQTAKDRMVQRRDRRRLHDVYAILRRLRRRRRTFGGLRRHRRRLRNRRRGARRLLRRLVRPHIHERRDLRRKTPRDASQHGKRRRHVQHGRRTQLHRLVTTQRGIRSGQHSRRLRLVRLLGRRRLRARQRSSRHRRRRGNVRVEEHQTRKNRLVVQSQSILARRLARQTHHEIVQVQTDLTRLQRHESLLEVLEKLCIREPRFLQIRVREARATQHVAKEARHVLAAVRQRHARLRQHQALFHTGNADARRAHVHDARRTQAGTERRAQALRLYMQGRKAHVAQQHMTQRPQVTPRKRVRHEEQHGIVAVLGRRDAEPRIVRGVRRP